MKILITAFDGFGGEKINPTAKALEKLGPLENVQLKKLLLPTVFGDSLEILKKEIREFNPQTVVCLGQAGGRTGISPERIAINIIDARIPDNKGNSPIDQPINPKGPAAYFSTLPIKAMVKTLQDHGIPSSVSNTAGSFVCNYIMYGLLDEIKDQPNMRGGFVHLPYLPEQVVDKNLPSMSLTDLVRALELLIQSLTIYKEDLLLSGGQED
ncbi:MAG TPA: pyroglutamyl-peptidase I [Clostridia bacterium]|nr:pyroglutamyl-peptidase I [Clostridia bacterium]